MTTKRRNHFHRLTFHNPAQIWFTLLTCKIQIEAILGVPDSALAHESSYGVSHLDRRQSVGHTQFQPSSQMGEPRPGSPYFGGLLVLLAADSSLFFLLHHSSITGNGGGGGGGCKNKDHLLFLFLLLFRRFFMHQLSSLLPPCVHCTKLRWHWLAVVVFFFCCCCCGYLAYAPSKEQPPQSDTTNGKPALFSGQSPSLARQGTTGLETTEGLLLLDVSQQSELILDWWWWWWWRTWSLPAASISGEIS